MERKELEEQIFEMIAQLYKKDAEDLSADDRRRGGKSHPALHNLL